MMNKIASLHEIFPDAQLININRDVADTLPSTLALNQSICSAFTSIKTNDRVKAQTIEQLVAWYEMAYESLHTYFPHSHIKVDFKKLIQQEKEEILRISEFLSVPIDQLVFPVHSGGKKHKNSNLYERLSKDELAPILLKLPFMKAYCHE